MKVELWAGKIVDTGDDGSTDIGEGGTGVTREHFIQRALQLDIINACLRAPTRELSFSH